MGEKILIVLRQAQRLQWLRVKTKPKSQSVERAQSKPFHAPSEAHNVCEEHRDIATTSLIEVWIDETERRTWFLFEATRRRN